MRALPRLAAAALCAAAVAPSTARADEIGGDIPLDGFRPALDARGFVTVDGGGVLAAGEPSFGLVTSWSRGLLELDGDGARYRVDDVVTPTLVAAIGLPGPLRLQVGASLPFGILAADRDPDRPGEPGQPGDDGQRGAQGLGDLGLHAKLRLAARGPWTVAAAAGVSLPTASRRRWMGSGATSLSGRAILERQAGRLRVGGNLGVRVRAGGDAVFHDDAITMGVPTTGASLVMGPAIPAGAAAAWAITPGMLDVIGEVAGEVALRGDYRPLEAVLALRVRLAEASHFTIGGGTGLGGAAGRPDLRAFAAILFEPGRGPGRPGRLEEVPPSPRVAVAEVGDRDGDGILDHEDLCPDDPEDFDGFEDDDGCPDPDNDGDGFLDHEDLCPDEAEDFDGYQDDDGCPDGGGRIAIGNSELEVFEDILFEFDSAVIDPRSHDILRVIASVLRANPGLTRIEIGGHTDSRGSAAYNRALSQRRAEAVRSFLVDEGVAGARLRAIGYGEDRPKVKGTGERVWRINRRVEFLIRERR
jgi:OmpA-OmpF porin, OOP family